MRSTSELPLWDDAWVVGRRGLREAADASRAHAAFVEPERTREGEVEDVLTLLLVNRECPFKCVMCDLWKYTTTERVADGAIARQVEEALRGHVARHIKLYNAGNFFDAQAVPPADVPRVAALVAGFRTVIIECHPRLVGPRCADFADRLGGQLHVAMGLETVHPDVLPRLNKRMTLDDFARAADYLLARGMSARAFILLRPPLLDEEEGVEWALRSVTWAQGRGVECCVLIPTRGGNGAMDELARHGLFAPPALASLERATAEAVAWRRGRVFADLWDIEALAACLACGPARIARLRRLNLEQAVPPAVRCARCGA